MSYDYAIDVSTPVHPDVVLQVALDHDMKAVSSLPDFVAAENSQVGLMTVDIVDPDDDGGDPPGRLSISFSISSKHADAIAVDLARRVGGKLIDLQTEPVRSRTRDESLRGKSGRVDIVDIHWYSKNSGVELLESFVDCALRWIPESIPRSWAKGGVNPKIEQELKETGFVALRPVGPGLGGFATNDDRDNGEVATVGITLWPDWMRGGDHLAKSLGLFADVSVSAGVYFASCELNRNALWKDGELLFDAGSERGSQQSVRGSWLGFPKHPVSWMWTSAELIADIRASGYRGTVPDEGLTVLSRMPVSRRALARRSSKSLVPAELRSTRKKDADGDLVSKPARYLSQAVVPPTPIEVVDKATLELAVSKAATRLTADGPLVWEPASGVSDSMNFGAVGLFHASVTSGPTEVSLWLEDPGSFWVSLETSEGAWSTQVFLPVSESDVIEWIASLASGQYVRRLFGAIQLESKALRLRSR